MATPGRLFKIATHLPGLLFSLQVWSDSQCRFIYANKAVEEIFFIPLPKALRNASDIWDRFHPDDLEEMRKRFAGNSGVDVVNEVKFRVIDPGKNVLWIAGQVSCESVEDGSIIWDGYLMNVTSQVEAELKAHRREALINVIFEHFPDRIYYKDSQSRILGGNQAWCDLVKKPLNDLIGKTDYDFFPGEIAEQLFQKEQKLLLDKSIERLRETHHNEDGSEFFLESIKCPLFNDDGSVIGLAGISRDVTEQVNLERELVKAREEAEVANRAKSAFLAMMSHEIRTPMNGVIGAASLLQGTELNYIQRDFVRTIQVSGENLLIILNDILDYSKIEAGKIELESVDFSLRECVQDSLDLFRTQASEKGIELACSIESAIPHRLLGDGTRLRQILVNLVSNAVKFTESGEIVIEVHRDSQSDVERNDSRYPLKITVRDTGIGIPEEGQKNLFEAFSQADVSHTRKFGGTGLGLVISRRLLSLMGGRIDFESEEGEGTCFTIELSLPISSHNNGEGVDLTEWMKSIRNRRILLVDDNSTNLMILEAKIEEWGARSRSFSSPIEALEHLREGFSYDLALLDFQMPGMDGVALARAIKLLPKIRSFPIIILSSVCEIPDTSSVAARLTKPIHMDMLQRTIHRLFSRDDGQNASSNCGRQPSISSDSERIEAPYNFRILIAEDNPINLKIANMMLQRLGYENKVTTTDGLEAVAAATDSWYDVILMDVQMPKMDGLQATRLIREHYADSDRKPWIIALTAGAMKQHEAEALDAGMNDYLPKPIKLVQLEDALSKVPVERFF